MLLIYNTTNIKNHNRERNKITKYFKKMASKEYNHITHNIMNLNDFYKQLRDQPTPQKEFRDKIASACGVTEMTVYRWLSGEIVPEKLKREKIAEITGLTVEELFPNLSE